MRVEGQLVFNGIFQILDAALAGFGLAHVPEDLARPHLARGRLQRVLEDWCPPWSGYHLYYPSRRQPSAAFALLVDAPAPPGLTPPGSPHFDFAPSMIGTASSSRRDRIMASVAVLNARKWGVCRCVL